MGITAVAVSSVQLNRSFRDAARAAAESDIALTTSPARPSLAAAIARVPNVAAVQVRLDEPVVWKTASGYMNMDLIGVQAPGRQRLDRFVLRQGAEPAQGQVLMEESDRSLAPVTVGGRVEVLTPRSSRFLTVSGLVRTPARATPDIGGHAVGYMDLSEAESTFRTAEVNDFLVDLVRYDRRSATAKQIARVIAQRRVRVLASRVGRDDALPRTVDDLLTVLWGASSLTLLACGVFLACSARVAVARHSGTPAVLRALGADRGQIARGCLGGMAALAIAGTLGGIVLGLLAADVFARYVASLYTVTVNRLTVSPEAIGLAAGLGVAVPILSVALAMFLAWRKGASGLSRSSTAVVHSSSDALAGRQSDTAPRPARLTRVSLAAQAVLRDLLRRRGAASLSSLLPAVGLLAVAGAVFLSAELNRESLNRLADSLPRTYRAGVFVSFPLPQPVNVARGVALAVPGVAGVEGLSQTRVSTRWGDAELTGLERNPRMYRRELVDGRWFHPDEPNTVVLSEDAARRSGLQVGDAISFHDDLHAAVWRVVGIARDASGLLAGPGAVGAIISSLQNVDQFAGLPAGFARGLMLHLHSPGSAGTPLPDKRIRAAFGSAGYQADVQTPREYAAGAHSQLSRIVLGIYGAMVASALLGAGALFIVLGPDVVERRRYISMLRALGAPARDVARSTGTLGVTLGLLAWPPAVAAGVVGAEMSSTLLARVSAPTTLSPGPSALAEVLLYVLGLCAAASFIPIWMAIRVTGQMDLRQA
jgi:ABC-type lipoprotein release transport system permease subunit